MHIPTHRYLRRSTIHHVGVVEGGVRVLVATMGLCATVFDIFVSSGDLSDAEWRVDLSWMYTFSTGLYFLVVCSLKWYQFALKHVKNVTGSSRPLAGREAGHAQTVPLGMTLGCACVLTSQILNLLMYLGVVDDDNFKPQITLENFDKVMLGTSAFAFMMVIPWRFRELCNRMRAADLCVRENII